VSTRWSRKVRARRDVWRHRYNNLTLHNEVVANHFRTCIPDDWPVCFPRHAGQLAGGLRNFLELMSGSTEVRAPVSTTLQRVADSLKRRDGSSSEMRLQARLMATGVSGGKPSAKAAGIETSLVSFFIPTNQDGLDWMASTRSSLERQHGMTCAGSLRRARPGVLMQRGATCSSLDRARDQLFDLCRVAVEDVDLIRSHSLPSSWRPTSGSPSDEETTRTLESCASGFNTTRRGRNDSTVYLRAPEGITSMSAARP